MLELKVWLPKYLKIDDQYQVVWNGTLDNLPIGTILQPYDTPFTQVVTFENYETVPENFRLVINQGIVTWLTIVQNSSSLENSTFLPTFINATMALVLRKIPVKNMIVSIFNLQPLTSEIFLNFFRIDIDKSLIFLRFSSTFGHSQDSRQNQNNVTLCSLWQNI